MFTFFLFFIVSIPQMFFAISPNASESMAHRRINSAAITMGKYSEREGLVEKKRKQMEITKWPIEWPGHAGKCDGKCRQSVWDGETETNDQRTMDNWTNGRKTKAITSTNDQPTAAAAGNKRKSEDNCQWIAVTPPPPSLDTLSLPPLDIMSTPPPLDTFSTRPPNCYGPIVSHRRPREGRPPQFRHQFVALCLSPCRRQQPNCTPANFCRKNSQRWLCKSMGREANKTKENWRTNGGKAKRGKLRRLLKHETLEQFCGKYQ